MAPLTAWQKHVQKVLLAGGTMKQASQTFDKKSGKAKKGATLRVKQKTKSGKKKTTSVRVIVPKKKNTPKKRPKGEQERKRIAFKKSLDDYARALGVPISKVSIKTGRSSTTVRIGTLVRVKRASMKAAVVEARKRARKRL